MEIMFFVIVMALLLAGIFAREAYEAKKREKQFIASLYKNYGGKAEKEYSLERFVRIGSYYEKHRREGQLDDITWNDLGMDELFRRMDSAFSASGEEYLYYTLRSIASEKEQLEHLEEVIAFFDTHPDERVRVQYLMKQLGHTGKFSLYDYLDNLDYLGERSNQKQLVLDFLLLPFLLLIPFQASVGIIGLLILIIYNMLSYFKEKKEIDPYILSFAYILRLVNISEKLVKIKVPVCWREWEEINTHYKALLGIRRGSFLVLSSTRGMASGNPLDIFMDYLRMILHLDLIKFNKMLLQLKQHMEDVDALITQAGYLETAIVIGSFRKSLPEYCIPKLEGTAGGLVLREGYHPLIENAVRNSISAEKGVLLTGSNASGKSTFLKMVALNSILAQTIHTCTAAEYRAPFYRIFSSMCLRDDLESGDSYYIVEIKALKRILDYAEQRSGTEILCFVDEVLRGTNTVERIAASTQILRSLSRKKILCFAATHDIELTGLLQEEYANYHFEEEMREGEVVFNYRLQTGKATTRNAIKLLQLMGYEPEIVKQAEGQAERFLKSGVWTVK